MFRFVYNFNNSDTWDVCFLNMEPGLAPEKNAEQYHVFVKWVFDSEEYNDRMNEEDFKLGGPNQAQVQQRVPYTHSAEQNPFSYE